MDFDTRYDSRWQMLNIPGDKKIYFDHSLVKDRLVSFVKYNGLVNLYIGHRIQTRFTKGVKNMYSEDKVMRMNDSVLY